MKQIDGPIPIGEVIPLVMIKITDPHVRDALEMLAMEKKEGLLLHPEQADQIREKFRKDVEEVLLWEERWALTDPPLGKP